MKFIIDPKLANRLESIHLRPNRIFSCANCNCNFERNGVKKIQGNYFCIHCGKPVVDITDTDAGQQVAGMMGLVTGDKR